MAKVPWWGPFALRPVSWYDAQLACDAGKSVP